MPRLRRPNNHVLRLEGVKRLHLDARGILRNAMTFRVAYRRLITEHWVYVADIHNIVTFWNDRRWRDDMMLDFTQRIKLRGNIRMQLAMSVNGVFVSTMFMRRNDLPELWERLFAKFMGFYDIEEFLIKSHPDRIGVQIRRRRQVPAGLNVSLHVIWVKPHVGGAPSAVQDAVSDLLKMKKSIIRVKNKDDNLCFARAMAILIVRMCTYAGGREKIAPLVDRLEADYVDRTAYPNLGLAYSSCKSGGRIQKTLALALHDIADTTHADGVDLSEIPKFEMAMQVKVMVYDARAGFGYAFKSSADPNLPIFRLVMDGAHYHALTTLKGLKNMSYECDTCDIAYSNKDNHKRCVRRCTVCLTRDCDFLKTDNEDRVWTKCDNCNRYFGTEMCYVNHMESVKRGDGTTSATCEIRKKCGKRGCKTFDPFMYKGATRPHMCGDTKCPNCDEVVSRGLDHKCFITKKDLKKKVDKFLFFDFECEQSTGVHKVTHAVASYASDESFTVFSSKAPPPLVIEDWEQDNLDCTQELEEMGEEKGCCSKEPDDAFPDVGDEFCQWVFHLKTHRGFTAIAHNGQGYDFQFILKWALDRNIAPTKVIRAGQKIKHMVIQGVRFIDSLSFLAMPLSAFPKTFGLKEMKKGYFPHYFNVPAHRRYVGVYPPPASYGCDSMSERGRADFLDWHKTKTSEVFDFQHEIVEYCKSDVKILKEGCMALREKFLEVAGVDPFAYITIAGCAVAVYRDQFMPERAIAVLDAEVAQMIREGFCGGRTCVMQAYVKSDPEAGRRIRYADVTSLYPWVNSTCEYPKGHPKVASFGSEGEKITDITLGLCTDKLGFSRVDVIPPQGLLHPVLPEKRDHRLQFDLLPKISKVFSSVELKEAVEQGYTIERVYETVWWEETTRDLFKEYVLTFLKLKMQSTSWGKLRNPDGTCIASDSDKAAWGAMYSEGEGIELDWTVVKNNPGMYALAKLMLNSLWGKFGQRPVQRKVRYLDDVAEIYGLFERFDIYNIREVGKEDIHEVEFEDQADERKTSYTTNIAVAAFTTAHARLKLYSALKLVGDRAVYCDTDSVVYMEAPGEPSIELGAFLGGWTDEIGGGAYIDEFAAAGPKMYAYRTSTGKAEVKCKGFRLNYSNAQDVLNFENIKRSVLGYSAGASAEEKQFESVTQIPLLITRNPDTKELVNRVGATKLYRPTLENKGVVAAESDTLRVLPFSLANIVGGSEGDGDGVE